MIADNGVKMVDDYQSLAIQSSSVVMVDDSYQDDEVVKIGSKCCS